ncbi:MAG: L-seryl-tRNA(Sec) selenium transferase [Pirellulaceae bacterium]|nr:L-seryl-tRNA(Sec) selenium transferase [Pirellulaceae bacterium]
MPNPFRNLPSVNQLLEIEPLKKMVKTVNHNVVADGVRTFLDDLRTQVSTAAEDIAIPTASEIATRVADWLEKSEQPALRPVINGTGILLHTGLGRAPLCSDAINAVSDIASGYASVELDLASGSRGQRIRAVESILCELTGAEAAAVVNNNAAATMLALAALASGKEVVVSRGQMIEIGGSYRLPDVMKCSGCELREVGTTNKTHPADFENAIGENTGALLKVHPSNFEVVGFTRSVSLEEMVHIGSQHNIPVIDDVGSGALVDFSRFGLSDEPVVSQSVKQGADVVLFSGDKLVGGPQCGIIVGKKKHVQRILRNPLMRAMRVGKMTLAALNATLLCYRNQDLDGNQIPLLRMLSIPSENLKLRAGRIAEQIEHLSGFKSAISEPCQSMLGGGSVPTQQIDSWCVSMETESMSVDALANQLRNGEPAVIGRIHNDRLVLDLRTIHPQYDILLVELLSKVVG